MDTLFEGLQEQSRLKIMDELRRFVKVDSRAALKIGGMEKNPEATKVNREMFPDAAVREVWTN